MQFNDSIQLELSRKHSDRQQIVH